MEFLGRVIVYPILFIVYIMLPFLDGPLSSLPSFKLSSPQTVWEDLSGQHPSAREFWGRALRLLCCYFFLDLPTVVGSAYIMEILGPVQAITTQNWPVKILRNIAVILVWLIWSVSLKFAAALSWCVLPGLFIAVLVPSLQCLIYFLRLFIYLLIKAVTHIFIVGLKNRRACQFLSALAAVLLGVTKAKAYAVIPVVYGTFLTIPDLDPDPWLSFKVGFSYFLMANMDEESLDAVLYSQSFKMVSSNEMMPVLRPVRATTTGACFVLREIFSNEDGHFTVEPEYKIGLGSITTATREDVIDVQIFTPYSGVKRKRMKNTPRARFNLDMSARFWRDHPEVGIWNEVLISAEQYYDEAKIHCISIDKWITFCGSDNYVFMEFDCELGT